MQRRVRELPSGGASATLQLRLLREELLPKLPHSRQAEIKAEEEKDEAQTSSPTLSKNARFQVSQLGIVREKDIHQQHRQASRGLRAMRLDCLSASTSLGACESRRTVGSTNDLLLKTEPTIVFVGLPIPLFFLSAILLRPLYVGIVNFEQYIRRFFL